MKIEVGTIYEFITKTDPRGPLEDSNRHPFVIIEYDGEEAVCCMITHTKPSDRFLYNKPLLSEWFIERHGVVGEKFAFNPTMPSYFLAVRLIKPSDYFDSAITRITGSLSGEGIAAIHDIKKQVRPMLWREYVAKYCRQPSA